MAGQFEPKSLDRRDVLRLQADARGRQPESVPSRASVARFPSSSADFDLVSGFGCENRDTVEIKWRYVRDGRHLEISRDTWR